MNKLLLLVGRCQHAYNDDFTFSPQNTYLFRPSRPSRRLNRLSLSWTMTIRNRHQFPTNFRRYEYLLDLVQVVRRFCHQYHRLVPSSDRILRDCRVDRLQPDILWWCDGSVLTRKPRAETKTTMNNVFKQMKKQTKTTNCIIYLSIEGREGKSAKKCAFGEFRVKWIFQFGGMISFWPPRQ